MSVWYACLSIFLKTHSIKFILEGALALHYNYDTKTNTLVTLCVHIFKVICEQFFVINVRPALVKSKK